jgi:hypothetical protein
VVVRGVAVAGLVAGADAGVRLAVALAVGRISVAAWTAAAGAGADGRVEATANTPIGGKAMASQSAVLLVG